MSSSCPQPTIPNELLRTIIVRVFAESIHSITLHPDDVEWEMDVIRTMCGVSFAFREIVMELASKAFGVKLFDDPLSGFLQVEKKFRSLRLLGMKLRRLGGHTSYIELFLDDSTLTLGYTSFLAALDLRHNTTGVTIQVFQSTQKLIFNILTTTLRLCGSIEPPEMADILCDAMIDEIELVRSGLDIVQGVVELNSLLDSWMSLQSSATAEDRELTHVRIHQELEKIEKVNERCPKSPAFHQPFTPAHLPGVLPTLKKFHAMTFSLDEYSISARLDVLLEKWSID